MRVHVEMPRLSDSMSEGSVTAWFKNEGDEVAEGEAIAEIETEKSTVDLPSPAAGVLARIAVAAGSGAVAVGVLLAEIETDAAAAASSKDAKASDDATKSALRAGRVVQAGSEAPEKAPAAPSEAAPVGVKGARGAAKLKVAKPAARGDESPTEAPAEQEIAATPLARRMAAQAGLALAGIQATGIGGKICKADVEAALGRTRTPLAVVPPRAAPIESKAASSRSPVQLVPRSAGAAASRVRRAIAERMARAKATIPHFYLSVDCRVDRLLDVRRRLKADGLDVSINDFVIRAAAIALVRVPEANASWSEADAGIAMHERIDIAVAVALDEGLVTPVVRAADTLGLGAIGETVRELAARAREGKLAPHEDDGATFTISNLGMHGVGTMFAIINPPQACILGVGAAEPHPVVENGSIVAGTVLTLSISADHRVLDGTTGAKLLAEVRRLLEEPARMLV